MKTMTISIFKFIFVFFIATSFGVFAQEEDLSLKDFKLVIEKTEDGLKLIGIEGSAWKKLAFKTNNHNPQAIDEYGMTKLGNISSENDPELADFLFTITKTEKGIILKGKKGMAWIDLRFNLPENEQQVINQYGMVSKN